DIINKGRNLGLVNLNIPEEYGGPGAKVFDEVIVQEELGYGCSGISTAMSVNNLSSLPIMLGGTEQQKEYWLGERMVGKGDLAAYCVTEPGAGSNVVGMQTRAERVNGKYIINGSKIFISNVNYSSFYTVFAVTDPSKKHKGISCFVIERDTPGISVSRHFDKLGQRAADTAEITFENVEVPAENRIGEEGMGFLLAMTVFDHSRPGVAAGAVGVGRRALEECVKYAKERETFGQPIWQHQAIGHKIADMAINVEAARLLTYQAAWLVDNNISNPKAVAFAKAFAADAAMKITVDAVQVFGGYGYMREYPVEKLMRDVKVFQIYEGTSEIQRNVIVRELFR
ncbi:MAG: acyl-CoA dehydrogenase family protein, partial [Chloroflexi bacterium]|uniref:acyl-CoA dehydrogenase family protein n=1 Tax=Candidatus Flexifilum breve TaxID=3140694 RepID=UPI0031367F8F|nr:acyl-CoA dehydrogenase family protein [Chloroflexota bacterium]